MDQSIVAPVIYGTCAHQTTKRGVIIPHEVIRELTCMLEFFNEFVEVERVPYYRIDAYCDEQSLWILEINASFVDGWGTALNLARASGMKIDADVLKFPRRFACVDELYVPELKLFIEEMRLLGIQKKMVYDMNEHGDEVVYVYGRVGSKDQPHVLPFDGIRLDNKQNLGLFSRMWRSDSVKIPRHFMSRFESWDNVPHEVVLKFCDKGSQECARARQSVMFGKPTGKASFIKRCYQEDALLAQEIIRPAVQELGNCQLIIFAIGSKPITGYVQYSNSKIINDNSIHGPLRIG